MANKIPIDVYKKILENMPVVCVDLVIVHNNKVLMVYRKNEPLKDQWCFPGGRIFKNEKLEDAVKRKALEETGLNVKIDKKIGIYEIFFEKGPFDDLKTGIHNIAVCFIVRPSDEAVKIDRTSSGYKWIDKIDEDLDSYVKKVLEDSRVFN